MSPILPCNPIINLSVNTVVTKVLMNLQQGEECLVEGLRPQTRERDRLSSLGEYLAQSK